MVFAEFSSFRPICGTQLYEQEPPNQSSGLPRVIRLNLGLHLSASKKQEEVREFLLSFLLACNATFAKASVKFVEEE